MYLIHEATVKNSDGIIDVTVYIVREKIRKKYEYHIKSAWAVEQFEFFYNKGRKCHGKALSFLNKFS
jgi:hypothetical protein